MYAFSPPGENSWLMRVAVSKTTFRLEKKWYTSWSRDDMLSRHRAPWKVGFVRINGLNKRGGGVNCFLKYFRKY